MFNTPVKSWQWASQTKSEIIEGPLQGTHEIVNPAVKCHIVPWRHCHILGWNQISLLSVDKTVLMVSKRNYECHNHTTRPHYPRKYFLSSRRPHWQRCGDVNYGMTRQRLTGMKLLFGQQRTECWLELWWLAGTLQHATPGWRAAGQQERNYYTFTPIISTLSFLGNILDMPP